MTRRQRAVLLQQRYDVAGGLLDRDGIHQQLVRDRRRARCRVGVVVVIMVMMIVMLRVQRGRRGRVVGE